MNKRVLSRDLKAEKLFVDRTERGNVFYRMGAATAKDQSFLVFKRDCGAFKIIWSADLRALEGRCSLTRSDYYIEIF